MTKRFELVWKDTGEVLHDNETGLDKGIYSPDYRFHVRDMMNELSEENEQLKQSIDTRISVEDNYRKHLEIYSDQYFKLKEYINELLTKKYNHYEEMKKTIRNKEAQRIYTNILKVIKELQEDVDTEWGS